MRERLDPASPGQGGSKSLKGTAENEGTQNGENPSGHSQEELMVTYLLVLDRDPSCREAGLALGVVIL